MAGCSGSRRLFIPSSPLTQREEAGPQIIGDIIMTIRSFSSTHLPHTSPLSTTTTNLTTSTQESVSSTAHPPLPPLDQPALLIPTDRSLQELESQAGNSKSSGVSWLAQLGRVRVDREVELTGYALYALRTWYALLIIV